MLKSLAWIAVVIVGLEVAYLVLANAFLSLSGVSLFFRSTQQIDAKYGSAWTVIPGTLWVRDLRVVFQDRNVQWSLDFDKVRVAIDLPALSERTFHARSVRGEGVAFRLRHRVDPLRADAPSVRALADIPEFPSPPVFETSVPDEPVSDADYHLWTVHIENVDVAIRELWVQQFRYLGSGHANGSFYLRPARWLWVGPATLKLDGAPLTAGPYLAAEQLAGEVDCIVDPHDVRREKGRNVFRFISSHVFLAGEGASSAPAALFLPKRFGIELRGTPRVGRISIDLDNRHGVFTEQSSFQFEEHDFALRSETLDLRAGAIDLFAFVEPNGQGRLRIDASGTRLFDRERDSAPIEIPRLAASLTSSSADAAATWTLTLARLERATVRAPDARSLNRVSSKAGIEFAGGRAEASVEGALAGDRLELQSEITARELSAHSRECDGSKWNAFVSKIDIATYLQRSAGRFEMPISVSASNVRVLVGDFPLEFNLQADIPQAEIDLLRHKATVTAAIQIDGLHLQTKKETVDNWWARTYFDFVDADLEGTSELAGTFHARMRDGTPLLAALADQEAVPGWLLDVLPLGNLEGSGVVQAHCHFVDVELARGSGGPLSFRGRLQRGNEAVEGALLVQLSALKPLSLGLELVGGKTSASLGAGNAWFAGKLRRLDENARQSRSAPCPKRRARCGD